MILASSSKRREEILKNMGFKFKIIPANISEKSDKDNVIEKVIEISYQKAICVAEKYPEEFVLAADTIVEFNGEILGKPKNIMDINKYLKMLSGNKHRVITAYSFININKNIYISESDISEVEFYNISDEDIKWYIESGEPFDKAGAYGIQGKGRIFVKKINGDFFSVMGFPIAKFIKNLKDLGIKIKDITKI